MVDESQYEIAKVGGMRKIYKALRGDQMLQKEALKILTVFSKNGNVVHLSHDVSNLFYLDKGKEYIQITKGIKYLLHTLQPELIIEALPQPQANVRNSYLLISLSR